MTEETDLITYLFISPNKFGIYLYDKKKQTNLFENENTFENKKLHLDIEDLSNFIEDNIFKIEKLIDGFVKNIILIIENNIILNLFLGIRKKNYDKKINEEYLKNTITEAKDLVKENYQDQKIMHILIKSYLVNEKHYSNFVTDLSSDNLSLEIQFICLPISFVTKIDKILGQFQIKVTQYIDGNYIKKFFINEDIKISEKANRIVSGYNENEAILVPKNIEKIGFFEKFFQLFS